MTTITKPTGNGGAISAERISYITPPASVRDTADGYIVTMEMPGVGKEGVEITFETPNLTVTGRRAESAPAGEFVYRESQAGEYRRLFELDPSIDAARIAAKIDQGVLTLTLPKSEEVKPRRIEVAD
jgi:HSP20 family protein